MNLMDFIQAACDGHTVHTLADFKMNMQTSDYSLKREIDYCPAGRVVRRTMKLPSRCTPDRADLCFVTHDGMYAMMFDTPVLYHGTDPYLYKLCRDGILVFDSWRDLTEFFRQLPYAD